MSARTLGWLLFLLGVLVHYNSSSSFNQGMALGLAAMGGMVLYLDFMKGGL